MDLRSTQLKDTYGNLVTTGTTAGSPTTGGLQNGQGTLLTGVGIGTNTTSKELSIQGNTPTIEFIDAQDINDVAQFRTSAGNAIIDADVNNDKGSSYIAFTVDGTSNEKMRIQSSGAVGINNSSPDSFSTSVSTSSSLVIGQGTSGVSPGLTLWQGNSAQATINFASANTGAGQYEGRIRYTRDTGVMDFRTNNVDNVLVLNASGNVGIGTDSPTLRLDVRGTQGSPASSGTSQVGSLSIRGTGSHFISSGMLNVSPFTGWFQSQNANDLSINYPLALNPNGGNVGIGTTSPNYDLHVNGSNTNFVAKFESADDKASILIEDDDTLNYIHSQDGYMSLGGETGLNAGNLNINSSSGNVGIGTISPVGSYTKTLHIHGSGTGASLHLTDLASGATASDGLEVFQYSTDCYIWEREAGNIRFGTSATERMRIDASGNLLVGTTSNTGSGATSGKQVVQFNGATGNGIYVDDTRTASGTDNAIVFGRGATAVGQIQTTTSSTSYVTSSDYRLKENVVEMTGALDRVDQLKPSRFNFIADADTTVDGFLAHEVADVVPEAITGEKDATEEYEVTPAVLDDEGNIIEEAVMGTRPVYQGIDQSKLVPLLVGAIQELRAEIEQLKN